MREICQSGSEGGEPQTNAASLPLSRGHPFCGPCGVLLSILAAGSGKRRQGQLPGSFGGFPMPTLTIEYRDESERLALEQAIAYVTDLRQLALDAPAGTVLDACERLA